MSPSIHRLLVLSIAACIAPAVLAQSGWKPAKNVEVIVGTSAGGAADYTARLLQKLLQRSLPGGALVVNKPGASYNSSFLYLNQHAGDGHYIAISPINLVTNRVLGLGDLSNADITPLAQLISDYHVFSVLTDSPVRTAANLVERLRKDPASLSIAISPSIGSANHFAVGTILKAAGIDIKRLKIVAFASAGESMTSVLGGHTDLLVSATPAVTPMIESGKMRTLAISSPKRLGGIFARVPTWKESGVDAVFSNWRGIVGPKNLTAAQIDYWDSVLQKLVQMNEWKEDLAHNYQDSSYMNSRETKAFLDNHARQFAPLIVDLGLAKTP